MHIALTSHRSGDDIANGIPPGPHEVHCEILHETADPGGGHEFRLISLTRWVGRRASQISGSHGALLQFMKIRRSFPHHFSLLSWITLSVRLAGAFGCFACSSSSAYTIWLDHSLDLVDTLTLFAVTFIWCYYRCHAHFH